jgi:hypothetical protein
MYDLERNHSIGPLDGLRYDPLELAGDDDAADLWAIDRIEGRGEESTDEAIDEEIAAYARDCEAEEQIEEWKWQRHRADVRRARLTGAWRVRIPLLCRPRARAPRSPRQRRRARRTSRTVSSRGDPDDPEPGRARPLAELAREAAA